jgi:hydrogenase maturation protein HypF
VGRRIEIRGVVQGVGFRPWVYRLATEQGLGGHVWNDAAGVTIEAFGPREALDAFMRRLESAFVLARAQDRTTDDG